jgi:IS30 family transposase
MRHSQGRHLTEKQISTIKRLLAGTDMTISEIAERLGRAKATIIAVNQKFKIRIYKGRSHWYVNEELKVS